MKKSIRVVIGSLNLGGAEKHISLVYPELVKRGWEVEVVTLFGPGKLADELRSNGVPVRSPSKLITNFHTAFGKFLSRPIKAIGAFFFLLVELFRKRDAILHFFLPEAFIIGSAAALLTRYPSPRVMSRRSLNTYQEKMWGIKTLEAFLMRKTDHILGNSQAVLDQMIREEAAPASTTGLIYNGIDLSIFQNKQKKTELRKQIKIHDCLTLVIVANLLSYKGHKCLLRSLSLIKDKLPSWQLVCIGKNHGILKSLKAQSKKSDLSEHIHWIDQTPNIVPYLFASDIGILCSHQEGFSNAILESMAASLPMVVTDVGGNAEAVIAGKTGLVVPAKNPEALSQALLELASSTEKRTNFGKAGRKRVEAHFSLNKCVDHYEDFYNKLLRQT